MTKGATERKNSTAEFAATTLKNSDAELLAACRKGDEQAWQSLVGRFERLISSIPRRAGLSEDLVAEVFQEVFLTLFEKMNDIEQPERLRAWLVTTAKFKTWRIVSREKLSINAVNKIDEEDENFFEIPDAAPLADAVLIELEEQDKVRAAVAALDERCRIIMTMLYLTEPAESYIAVAKKIGVNETSISPLRARCLKKMLKTLTQ
jgi:RNA polymerase sigma factor (sigma-70 family)